ncbi:MAG: hypothetical protein R2873_24855 [Caldilineaceae bacterium]
MEIGIFSRTFPRPRVEETWTPSKRSRHLRYPVQLPAEGRTIRRVGHRAEDVPHVRQVCDERGIRIAVSGTYNMIHPDPAVQAAGRARHTSERHRQGWVHAVTLCTGTRDVNSMWRHHPDNDTDEAWRPLASLEDAHRGRGT